MNKTRGKIHTKAYPKITPTDVGQTWKIFQIIAEFVEGYERLAHVKPAISIFGSARLKPKNELYQAALDTAKTLSDAGFSIITGGGPGIMEAANRGASEGKSLSIGLNIDLPFEESANDSQDISLRYRFFFTRKTMFIKHSTAYICMPGGFGTIDEMFDILTLIQTKKKRLLPVYLFHRPFWSGLYDWMKDTLIENGTIDPKDMDLLTLVDSKEEILEHLNHHLKYVIDDIKKSEEADFQF